MRKPFQMFLRYSSSLESSGSSGGVSASTGWPLWEWTQREAIQSPRGSQPPDALLSHHGPCKPSAQILCPRNSPQGNNEISVRVGSRVNNIKYHFTPKQLSVHLRGISYMLSLFLDENTYTAVKMCLFGASEITQQVKDSRNLHGGRRKLTPARCALASTHVSGMHTCAYIDTNSDKIKF